MDKRIIAVALAVAGIFGMGAIYSSGQRGAGILNGAASAIVAEAAGKSPAPKAKEKKPALDTRAVISKSVGKGQAVVLYFYADQIKDSLDDFKKVEAAAAKIKAVAVKAEAYQEQDLSFDYGVEYVPSVFVIKPGVGVADAYIVNVDSNLIAANKAGKQSEGMESVRKGVKGKKPTLLFFMADWCGYCQKTLPEVKKYQKEYGNDVNIVEVNIERDARMGEVYLVSGVPVLVALDANGAIYRRMGYPAGYGEFEKVFGKLGVKKKKKPAAAGAAGG